MSPASCAGVVRKVCRDRTSEAYPCREKWREISRHFFGFWLPNALLTAPLSGNPANLGDHRAFLADARPHDDAVIV